MTGTLSTIDTTKPAQGAQLISAIVRGNFIAAANDINNLYGIVQSGTGIGTQSITYSQIQAEGTQTLLGNPWGTSQSPQEIKLGASLTFVTGSLQTVAMTNDVVSPANSLVGTIAAGAVTNAKFRNSAGLSVVGNSGTVTGTVADITGVNNQVLVVTGSVLQFGTVPVGAGGIGTNSLTAHNIVVGNGANPPALIPPVASGDLLLDQGVGTNAAFFAMVGDGSIVNTGTLTVSRVNSVSYPSAAATPNRAAIVTSAGTVTYVQVPNAALVNQTISIGGQAGTLGGTLALSTISTALGANVALTASGSYFDIVSIGGLVTTGTYTATGRASVTDPTASTESFFAKLWDGTTVVDSPVVTIPPSGGAVGQLPVYGIFASSSGTIKISVREVTGTTGTVVFNNSGNSKDTTLNVVRIG